MSVMQQFLSSSYLFGANAPFIEELYEAYLDNPQSVPQQWREYFDKMQVMPSPDGGEGRDVAHAPLIESFVKRARQGRLRAGPAPSDLSVARKQVYVQQLIGAYRFLGARWADLDPLKRQERSHIPELEPGFYDLTETDMDMAFDAGSLYFGAERLTLREIIKGLRDTYCGTIGAEYMYIGDPGEKRWIQQRLESCRSRPSYAPEFKRYVLERLSAAETLEKHLHTRYVGQKRFSGEGGESLIPMLDHLLQRAGAAGVQETVIGMAHRGRLNVLVNVLGKLPKDLFSEFEGKHSEELMAGDVKYHQGFSSDVMTPGGPMHLTLAFNPSHLEIVNPVVEGSVRARQHRRRDKEGAQVLPVLIHGDAAFAGQGVVMETLNLSQTRGYGTGGTVHIVLNNQIGFTTSDPRDTRSTIYCTDVAKMVEAPILHVNGDDPEAVVFAARVAAEFRQQFQKPVVIDMWCYRRFGHNEGDEPGFTQPLMYKKIRAHRTALDIYADRLIAEGVTTREDVDRMKEDWRTRLNEEFEAGQSYKPNKADWLDGRWAGKKSGWQLSENERRGQTGVALETLQHIGAEITSTPPDFHAHRTIQRFLDNRKAAIEHGGPIDWATAEALAISSLLYEGYNVRLSGQDSERGTFSQRHSVLIDQENEARYLPFNHIAEGQGRYEVVNSMLSEEAVLGFEYGYSLAEPDALVLWEAQFGDFANGAQVVFDQFISSAERKWLRMSGLVCLLPHGYEGQGPEHSSARLERYLQLCAEDNMQVANCTTPANYFHILRRQLHRSFRKPLVLMTPKSLLRHKRAVSRLGEMGMASSFQRLLLDDAETAPNETFILKADENIRRVILCSGKVYYDLLDEREKRGVDDVYLLRVEQLYPFPLKGLVAALGRFRNADVVWCQEEPKNMGAWSFVDSYLEWVLTQIGGKSKRARYIGRTASASTATGTMSRHLAQLKLFLEEAFAP